jgi:hypothetical protein
VQGKKTTWTIVTVVYSSARCESVIYTFTMSSLKAVTHEDFQVFDLIQYNPFEVIDQGSSPWF